MRIVVSGSSGMIGSALVQLLVGHGHTVRRLVRSKAQPGNGAIQWDTELGSLDKAGLEGHDAVVHLAGKGIASERWTAQVKADIRESRVNGTKALSEALTGLSNPPKVLVAASAIGYYGDRGDELLREDSPPGSDFLAGTCRDWEAATEPAATKGIRVVNLRIGVVISTKGGALSKMLTPFKLGLGGQIGPGDQYMSWIALDDIASVCEYALTHDDLVGPVNAVAPNPVTNLQFTKTLGKVLGRPTVFPVPDFGARLAFGEMADALLLSSQRVEPAKLVASGYSFQYRDLEPALRHVLAGE